MQTNTRKTMKFSELLIKPALEAALSKENIIEPTAIQEKSIPLILNGKDIYLSSETGTGKTLAYLLPLISKLDTTSRDLQVMILTPTHELASQIIDQLKRIQQNSDIDIRSQLLIGTASIKRQLENLKKKPHIVAGSAGRLLELIKMRKLKVHNVKSVVIDEADKLLYTESVDTIKEILRSMLKGRQLIFASATNQAISNEVAKTLAPDLIQAHTGSNQISSNIDHIYFEAHENEKPKLLSRIINACKPERAIIFTHRNETARRIAKKLSERKKNIGEIHGDCDKQARQNTINQFRSGKINILVASDMAARGLDVKGVTHIFNFDIPAQSKDYLHRAGRTGRAGANGYCISLMSGEEQKAARRYERELKIKMHKATIFDGVIKFENAPKNEQ